MLSLLSSALTPPAPSVTAAPAARTSLRSPHECPRPAAVPSPLCPRLDLRGHTVLVLHAHPDDEAIFTGLTLRRLADAGARTVLVVATDGDLGGSRVPLRRGETVGQRRRAELERGRRDARRIRAWCCSATATPACPGGPMLRTAARSWRRDPLVLARHVAEIADAEGAGTVVHDDEHGIYGHPDHRARGGSASTAAGLVGATAYAATVDREHLHVVARDGHLVHGAARAARRDYGRVTAEIGARRLRHPRADLEHKRAAIIAHASQIGPGRCPAGRASPAAYGSSGTAAPAPGLLDRARQRPLSSPSDPQSRHRCMRRPVDARAGTLRRSEPRVSSRRPGSGRRWTGGH